MFANSRGITSAQEGVHPDLDAVVRKHLLHPFRKPVTDYNRQAFEQAMEAWRGWKPGTPLILDSGCGVGWSTVQLARQWPDAFVLGVDQSADRLGRGKDLVGEQPGNMALVRSDLVDFWRLLVEARVCLERHYLLYPNPWPKVGHLQRRWHGHPVFSSLLPLGGVLECRSNWCIYVEELARALELATGRPVPVLAWVPEGGYLTPFERKYHESGQELWRLTLDLQVEAGQAGAEHE